MLHLLGLDPGLGVTGWGVIGVAGNRLSPIGCGVIATCGLVAAPVPTTACLTVRAAYSATGMPASAGASRATPRA